MVVASETTNPDLSCVVWSGGAARRFARGSWLLLVLTALTPRCFHGIIFEVIPGFGTSWVVYPPLSSKVLSWEKFSPEFCACIAATAPSSEARVMLSPRITGVAILA